MVEFKQNVMFDPKQEADARRKRMFADQLIQKSNQPFKNEMAGGMTVARSPWENISNIADGVLGQYQANEADKEFSDVTQKRQKLMGEALSQLKDNPQGAAQILNQDPSMMDTSLKLYGDALNRDRDEQLRREQFALQMQLQQMPTAEMRNFDYYNNLPPEMQQSYQDYRLSGTRGGSIPAPMQTANRMWELEQIARDTNMSPQERLDAETQYNLLGQAAKTYGYAGGVEKNFGINMPNQPMPNTPQQPNQMPANNVPEAPDMTVMPQAPLAENPQSVTADQFNQIFAQPTVQPVSGFGGAVAGIAAQKKGAEEQAKKINSAMPATIVKEQNDIVDKVNVAQSLEANMGKFVNQIDGGQLDLGLMANLENMARNNVGMSTEQSRNLSSFKSSLERLRNESLRLNTGVQTDGDAQRAWNELISSINDPQLVRQRLTEIEEINRKGSQLQNQKLNMMRSEYGRGELNIPNINQSQQPNINKKVTTGQSGIPSNALEMMRNNIGNPDVESQFMQKYGVDPKTLF